MTGVFVKLVDIRRFLAGFKPRLISLDEHNSFIPSFSSCASAFEVLSQSVLLVVGMSFSKSNSLISSLQSTFLIFFAFDSSSSR